MCPNNVEVPCGQNTYQDSIASSTCNNCPANSKTAAQGSTRFADCICNDGYYLDYTNRVCALCAAGSFCKSGMSASCTAGTYQPLTGQSSCTACSDPNSSTNPGATSADQCLCKQGYYLPTGQTLCAPCPPGATCTGALTSCPKGFYLQSGNCFVCPPTAVGADATSFPECRCNDGLYITSKYSGTANLATEFCIACPLGYRCSAGQLIACEKGSYNDVPGATTCTPCDSKKLMTTATTAATNRTQCYCVLGTYLGSDGVCVQCPAGTTCRTIGQTKPELCLGNDFTNTPRWTIACRQCPSPLVGAPDVSAPAGSGNTRCICPDGQKSDASGTTCVDCGAGEYCVLGVVTSCRTGTYQPSTGKTSCLDCPVGTTTLSAGAKALSACVCRIAGYWNNSGSCETCPAGYSCNDGVRTPCAPEKFQPDKAQSACLDCPSGLAQSVSPDRTACLCATGFQRDMLSLNCTCIADATALTIDDCRAAARRLLSTSSALAAVSASSATVATAASASSATAAAVASASSAAVSSSSAALVFSSIRNILSSSSAIAAESESSVRAHRTYTPEPPSTTAVAQTTTFAATATTGAPAGTSTPGGPASSNRPTTTVTPAASATGGSGGG
eukprot:Opistho-1_new@73732